MFNGMNVSGLPNLSNPVGSPPEVGGNPVELTKIFLVPFTNIHINDPHQVLNYRDFTGISVNQLPPKFFTGKSLDHSDLSGLKLAKWDMQNISAVFANLSRVNLSSSNLFNANLNLANLSQSDFRNANLSGASLVGVNAHHAIFDGANMQKANMPNAKLAHASLRNADLRNAILAGADLCGVDLSAANLEGANLQGANLKGANLKDAHATNVNFHLAILNKANLEGEPIWIHI